MPSIEWQRAGEWFRSSTLALPTGVDREHKVLRGYVVAEAGRFKTPGRGEFDQDSLSKIVELMNAKPKGVKSHFAHPDLSADGTGRRLGWARDARLDGDKVRADLHFLNAAFHAPEGNLAGYVMDLAEEDPQAIGSSLVVQVDKKYRLDEKGHRQTDEKGDDLPPLWYPTAVHGSDIVNEGDAVHGGLLSAGVLDLAELPDAALYEGCAILDRLFPNKSREQAEQALRGFLERYLARRYGEARRLAVDVLRRRLEMKRRNPLS